MQLKLRIPLQANLSQPIRYIFLFHFYQIGYLQKKNKSEGPCQSKTRKRVNWSKSKFFKHTNSFHWIPSRVFVGRLLSVCAAAYRANWLLVAAVMNRMWFSSSLNLSQRTSPSLALCKDFVKDGLQLKICITLSDAAIIFKSEMAYLLIF